VKPIEATPTGTLLLSAPPQSYWAGLGGPDHVRFQLRSASRHRLQLLALDSLPVAGPPNPIQVRSVELSVNNSGSAWRTAALSDAIELAPGLAERVIRFRVPLPPPETYRFRLRVRVDDAPTELSSIAEVGEAFHDPVNLTVPRGERRTSMTLDAR
jgi:hypothetical protein